MTNIPTSILPRYIGIVNRFSKLSREEESELWRRWRVGSDAQAKEVIVRSNLRHAVSLALKYRHYGMPVSELIAEGNYGLACALSKFDPERGNRFITYASHWIRAFILDHIIRSWSLVGAGTGPLRSKQFFRLRRERIRVQNLVGEGEHADRLLAERFGVSREQMNGFVQRLDSRDVSLDREVSEGFAARLIDTIPSPGCDQEQAYVDAQDARRTRNIVRAAFDVLDEREKLIVKHRLMSESEDKVSFADIGRHLGVSRERARQLEGRAKRKLRNRILELSGNHDLSGLGVNSAA